MVKVTKNYLSNYQGGELLKGKFCLVSVILAISLLALSCGNSTEPIGTIKYAPAWDGTVTEPTLESDWYIITESAHLAWLAEQTTAITKNIRFDAISI